MKRFVPLLLLAIPAALLAGEGPWFKGSLQDATSLAKKENKALFVRFYADW